MNRLSAGLLVLIAIGFCGESSPAGPRTVELRDATVYANQSFGFRAHQSATGEITGYIVSNSSPDYSAPFVIEGRVRCLRVLGNRASIGGELQRYFQEDISEASQYHGWVFFVEDNSAHPGTPDRISKYIYVSNTPVTDCPIPGPDSATEDVRDADVVVSTEE